MFTYLDPPNLSKSWQNLDLNVGYTWELRELLASKWKARFSLGVGKLLSIRNYRRSTQWSEHRARLDDRKRKRIWVEAEAKFIAIFYRNSFSNEFHSNGLSTRRDLLISCLVFLFKSRERIHSKSNKVHERAEAHTRFRITSCLFDLEVAVSFLIKCLFIPFLYCISRRIRLTERNEAKIDKESEYTVKPSNSMLPTVLFELWTLDGRAWFSKEKARSQDISWGNLNQKRGRK